VVATGPHDAQFRAVFGDLDNATSVLRTLVSPSVASALDWSTLAVEPGSYVDPRFPRRETDLLFSASLGGSEVRLYLLLEHQSSNDASMALRMLRYMVRIWSKLAEDPHRRPLPPIIPLLVSHARGGWSAPTRLCELFDPRAVDLAPQAFPDFQFHVLDLARTTDAQLRGHDFTEEAALTLWALRDSRDGAAFLRGLRHWSDPLRRLETHPSGREKLQRLWHYIVSAGPDMQLSEIHAILEDTNAVSGEIVMNMLDRARTEGAKAGKLEGQFEGRAASLLLILDARGLVPSPAVRQRIETCTDHALLSQWTTRAVGASTLDEVFGAAD